MEFSTTLIDPQHELWADPEFVDAYLDALGQGDEAWADADPAEVGPCEVRTAEPWTTSDVLEEVAATVRRGRVLAAEQDRLFHEVLADAAADPDPWVGDDPTRDPEWVDPRGRSAAVVRARRRDLAVRAAAADLGVRVQLSDHQVRARAHRADVLSTRCPKTWQAYRSGQVPEQNAVTAAQLADTLPARAKAAWAAFDDAVAAVAGRTAPGRFRVRAGAVRERVHPESIDERHARAAADRTVRLTAEYDGMTRIEAYLPAIAGHAIDQRVDADARHLAAAPDETRTLAQLRADVFADLLTATAGLEDSGGGARGGGGIAATVNVTIPVLTLLGQGDEPATLDGYGPIDVDTARRLAGGAAHWVRVLTHPVTGTVLDVDRRVYRVPKPLRRWLGVRHPTCMFPGCNRPARLCDIDHRQRWADGGATAADNLGPLCGRHHPIKDETRWQLDRDPADGTLTWTSPTGHTTDADPPPF